MFLIISNLDKIYGVNKNYGRQIRKIGHAP
jgi:hypothetical protein